MNKTSNHNKINNHVNIIILLFVLIGTFCSLLLDVSAQDVNNGKDIFEKRCYYCHGLKGGGDGPVVPRLDPKPRNFQDAHFKFRTTPFNTLPTEDDLLRTINEGVSGTAMPFFSTLLKEQEIRDVIEYIKTFSERWKAEGPGQPISISSEPPMTPETIKLGEEVFKKAKCFICHGDEGRGNGSITNTMRNEWGYQFKARNFTRGWLFKRGNTVKDIFITISTGLNGTPMGSYFDLLTEDERWHLTHFVKSLNREIEPVTISGGSIMIQSVMIEQDIPTNPDDPIWTDVGIPTEIATGPQLMVVPRQWVPSLLSITVRSIFNKDYIGFLLEWDDRTGVQDKIYRDAVALQFPNKLKEGIQKPHFAMGATGGAVNIWHWRADYNEEAAKEGYQNIKETVGGNFIQESNAKGFKAKPVVQPVDSQTMKGGSVWRDGKWKVVMIRPLETGDKKDIQFEKNKNIPIAFASWDGANNDIGGRHNVAPWYYLILLTPETKDIYVYIALAVIMAVGGELWFVARLRRRIKPVNKFLNFDFSKEGHK